LSKAWNWS